MSPEVTEADARDIEPYDIDGYSWEKKSGSDVEPGDLLPGHCGEVYRITERAGRSFSGDSQFFAVIIVEDGNLDYMPDFTTHREDNNSAMEERVHVVNIDKFSEHWVLAEEE